MGKIKAKDTDYVVNSMFFVDVFSTAIMNIILTALELN